jgi:hypothetical protein
MIDLNPAIMFDVPRRDVFRLAGAGGGEVSLLPILDQFVAAVKA